MPAHNAKNKDREFGIHLLVVKKMTWDQPVPDGHAQIEFRWRAGVRQWEIKGVLEPESPFLKPKHNWTKHDTLPQGHGDAILAFLKWVQWLTEETPTPETEDSSEEVEESPLPE